MLQTHAHVPALRYEIVHLKYGCFSTQVPYEFSIYEKKFIESGFFLVTNAQFRSTYDD